MEYRDRIVSDPSILSGKPCIRGTRLSVDLIVHLLACGWTVEQIVADYKITAEDVAACRAFAAESARRL